MQLAASALLDLANYFFPSDTIHFKSSHQILGYISKK